MLGTGLDGGPPGTNLQTNQKNSLENKKKNKIHNLLYTAGVSCTLFKLSINQKLQPCYNIPGLNYFGGERKKKMIHEPSKCFIHEHVVTVLSKTTDVT